MRNKQSWFDLARVLAILGGIVTVVSGALEVLSLLDRRNFPAIEELTRMFIYAGLVIGLGLLAVVGSRQVKNIAWSVVLIIAGLLAYQFDGSFPWLFGPVLVVVAGIIGVVGKLA